MWSFNVMWLTGLDWLWARLAPLWGLRRTLGLSGNFAAAQQRSYVLAAYTKWCCVVLLLSMTTQQVCHHFKPVARTTVPVVTVTLVHWAIIMVCWPVTGSDFIPTENQWNVLQKKKKTLSPSDITDVLLSDFFWKIKAVSHRVALLDQSVFTTHWDSLLLCCFFPTFSLTSLQLLSAFWMDQSWIHDHNDSHLDRPCFFFFCWMAELCDEAMVTRHNQREREGMGERRSGRSIQHHN